MEEGKRKVACESLQIIEGILVIDLLTYWREEKIPEFWNAVESLDKFLEMKSKLCFKD